MKKRNKLNSFDNRQWRNLWLNSNQVAYTQINQDEKLKAQLQASKVEVKADQKNDKNDKNKSPQKGNKDQKEKNPKDQNQGKNDKKDTKAQDKTDPKQKKK
ncbi:unnamed protein product (macronuclear) [Paramecium tetraurelia]|uniref:Uncharacterized protein n=1 Tax=Paramecium tetraurelia TaxID=5888 RepID=A0DEQ4_PARTE|nr:uncharacterized protein GSPATT00016347001 [Paramecium tetraurelia]CAK81521.1 unnamed protein product [Paramecium tetraurelia]|eukprot:XP_001448918.1 hypothetical protein (macronuclear) [Paramecium tetraurelia strain d4-2]